METSVSIVVLFALLQRYGSVHCPVHDRHDLLDAFRETTDEPEPDHGFNARENVLAPVFLFHRIL